MVLFFYRHRMTKSKELSYLPPQRNFILSIRTCSINCRFLFEERVVAIRCIKSSIDCYSRFLSLPTIVFGFVLPFWMKLSHVLLRDKIKVFLVYFLAIGVVVDSALSVAFDHILPEQSHRLVRDLSLSGTLFRRQQKLDGVLGTAGLYKKKGKEGLTKIETKQSERCFRMISIAKVESKAAENQTERTCDAINQHPLRSIRIFHSTYDYSRSAVSRSEIRSIELSFFIKRTSSAVPNSS